MLKRKSVKRLAAKAEKDVLILKKAYKKSFEKGVGLSWLGDNYHIYFNAFREIFSSLAEIKRLPSEGKYPRIYEYCADFLSEFEFSEKNLYDYLFGIELQFDELKAVPVLLKYCCVNKAATAVKSRSDFSEGAEILRKIDDVVWDDFFEKIYYCADMLKRFSCFEKLDIRSKRLYLDKICENAEKQKVTEAEYIEFLAEKSGGKDISEILFAKKPSLYFPCLISAFSLFFILDALILRNFAVLLFSVVPIYFLARFIVDKIYEKIKKTEIFSSVKLCGDVKTLVCTVALVSDVKGAEELIKKTEKCFFAEPDDSFLHGLLIDLPSSECEFSSEDEALCNFLSDGIRALNEKHGDNFFLAVRKRSLDKSSGKYRGRERKRGAVSDFCTALCENDFSEFGVSLGDFSNVKYLTLLDEDTFPEPSSVKRLVGVLEYPLSRPEYDVTGSVVEKGYGVAVPSFGVLLSDANKTGFSYMKNANSGKEPYSKALFSVGNDLFGEGIFCGKGVVNVKVFSELLSSAFEEGRILSHDIPEGNILRCAYVSDVFFYEDVPDDVVSFTERGCRWIKGDIQNAVFLTKTYVNAKKRRVSNEMRLWGKFLILNNILSAFYFPSVFLLICSSVFFGILPVLSALFIFFFEDIAAFVRSLFRRVDVVKLRYRGYRFSPNAVAFFDRLFSFMCLPYVAVKNTVAVVCAVISMKTGKGLLEWKTSGTLGGKDRSLVSYFAKMYPQFIGIFLFFFPTTAFFGVIWLSAFFIATLSAKSRGFAKNGEKYSDIKSEVSVMWKYFSTFVNAENNFLPPDNFQEEPVRRLAARTSPTNIGLYLTSALAVYYLGIIDEKELEARLENTLSTVLRLKKYNGQLYNWYSTEDLSVLQPEFISTVDNGNFICALVTVRNAVEKIGICRGVVKKITEIEKMTDFTFLYDGNKKLLSIGFDVKRGKLSESFYDTYASEVLLAYYYAISERQIDAEAWTRLNRYRYIKNGYSCIKSWSGTVFEYFMPFMFLPVEKRSFNDEMLRAAVAEQRKRNPKGLWGNSESCFYSFDDALNYEYKAFGVQALALDRGANKNNVVSPYSSFLTLPFSPEKAYENLKNFKAEGIYGEYGFYDAADLTERRTGKKISPVKNYMAHHVAMSILSAANYLTDGLVSKDFFDLKRQAYRSLIEEKNPIYARGFSLYPHVSFHKGRAVSGGREFSNVGLGEINVGAVTNGKASLVFSDVGNGCFSVGKTLITKRKVGGDGVFGNFAFFISRGRKYTPFFSASKERFGTYKTTFGQGKVSYFLRRKNIELKFSETLSCERECAVFEFSVKNCGQKKHDGDVLFYTEPILSTLGSYLSHPAFSELFLDGYYDCEKKTAFVFRKRREDGKIKDWLAFSVCDAETSEKQDLSVSFSRYAVLGRGGSVYDINSGFSSGGRGDGAFCLAAKTPLTLDGYKEKRYFSVLSYGESKDAALENAEYSFLRSFAEHSKSVGIITDGIYTSSGVKKPEVRIAEAIRTSVFVKKEPEISARGIKNGIKEDFFWSKKISTDRPIAVFALNSKNKENVLPFLRCAVAELKLSPDFNAVFCFTESDGYRKSVYNFLKNAVSECDGDGLLWENLFLVEITDPSELRAFEYVAGAYVDLSENSELKKPVFITSRAKDVEPVELDYEYECGDGGYLIRNGEVCFGTEKRTSQRAVWGTVMANDGFGTVVTENSPGFTFAKNSGLNKLTRWSNDPVSAEDGERLFVYINGVKYDLLRNASAVFCKGEALYYSKVGKIKFTVKIFLKEKSSAKITAVSFNNPDFAELVFEYCIAPVLDEREKFFSLKIYVSSNVLFFENGLNMNFSGCAYLFAVGGKVGKLSAKSRATSLKKGEEIFVLGFEKDRNSALSAARNFELSEKRDSENGITLHTPDEKLNYLFSFLKYQTETSRIKARCGYYQCGGAVGFRDRLQDAVCLSAFEPELLYGAVLSAASRQFFEGDVLHWWHDCENGKIKGSRTRSSDDLLWLPYSLAAWYKRTESTELAFLKTPYIIGDSLNFGERERYIEATLSDKTDTVYVHAKKAILKAATSGEHGLVLFGSGDWNDGMTSVGKDGKGESVWTTMFIIRVMKDFLLLSEKLVDVEFSEYLKNAISKYVAAVEKNCFDGDRYIRGFYDDGVALGAKSSDECSVDILPQAFSAICDCFSSSRVEKALETAEKLLVDKEKRIVKLLWPPFDKTEKDPGYIKGYLPGVRENGGQYTHAALWYVLALFERKKTDNAYEILSYLNPLCHTETPSDVELYKKEPYVLCGDVYADGTGGWSFYTGSSGWYFKIVTEKLLGLSAVGKRLFISPSLPSFWNGYSATVRLNGTVVDVTVEKGKKQVLTDNGKPVGSVALDGGYHRVFFGYVN